MVGGEEMKGFKIVCDNCGQSTLVDQPKPTGYKEDSQIELRHDADVGTTGFTGFYMEISCASCGNSFKMDF